MSRSGDKWSVIFWIDFVIFASIYILRVLEAIPMSIYKIYFDAKITRKFYWIFSVIWRLKHCLLMTCFWCKSIVNKISKFYKRLKLLSKNNNANDNKTKKKQKRQLPNKAETKSSHLKETDIILRVYFNRQSFLDIMLMTSEGLSVMKKKKKRNY